MSVYKPFGNGWIACPKELLRLYGCNIAVVYSVMLNETDTVLHHCTLRHSVLAKICHLTRRTVIAVIQKLIDIGLVRCVHRRQDRCAYEILPIINIEGRLHAYYYDDDNRWNKNKLLNVLKRVSSKDSVKRLEAAENMLACIDDFNISGSYIPTSCDWLPVPKHLLQMYGCKIACVYAVMLSRSNSDDSVCRVRQEQIAEACGLSLRTIVNTISDIVNLGIVIFCDSTQRQNIYIVVPIVNVQGRMWSYFNKYSDVNDFDKYNLSMLSHIMPDYEPTRQEIYALSDCQDNKAAVFNVSDAVMIEKAKANFKARLYGDCTESKFGAESEECCCEY